MGGSLPLPPFVANMYTQKGVNCAGLGLILSVGLSLYPTAVKTGASAIVCMATAITIYLGYSSLWGVIVGGLLGFFLSPMCLNIAQAPSVGATTT